VSGPPPDRVLIQVSGPADVTVCIPCYEQSVYLQEALASVRAQTRPVRETIVIDDGSSPAEANLIRSLCDEHDARYLRVTNRGLPAARNTGIMAAAGEWFLPLDADDWLRSDYVAKTVAVGTRMQADVVLTGIQEYGQRTGCYKPGFDRPWQRVTADLILRDYNRFYYASLIRVSLLREVGGYNPKMSRGLEDADLWVDLLRRGARFAAVEDPVFEYRTRADGMLQTIHRDGGYQQMVAEMRRHHS